MDLPIEILSEFYIMVKVFNNQKIKKEEISLKDLVIHIMKITQMLKMMLQNIMNGIGYSRHIVN